MAIFQLHTVAAGHHRLKPSGNPPVTTNRPLARIAPAHLHHSGDKRLPWELRA